jgi:glycosyltransferase involved in cell wall biosynthesis
MKKILFIINSLGVGGAERVLVDDINEMLKRSDVEICLVTLRPETDKTFAHELLLDRLSRKTVSIKNMFDLGGLVSVLRLIHKEKPDAIVSHLWYANTVAKLCSLFGICRNVVTFEQNMYDTIKSKKSFLLDRILQRFSRKIVAVSHSVKDSLVRHGIKAGSIEVLYNSVAIDKFLNPQELTAPLPQKVGTTTFLFIGRLIPQKNVELLIEAFESVPDATLYIVGKGFLQSSLESLVKAKGLDDRIFFLGVRNDIVALMQSCDCFVLPSRYEGFSLVLIEAMAAGMPIMVTDFLGAKEVIIDRKNGIIVSQTKESIAQGCVLLAQDQALRKHIGYQARQTANMFSIQKHVDALMQILGNI